MPTHSRTYQAPLNDIAALYTATRASVVRMYWEVWRRLDDAGEVLYTIYNGRR